MAQVNRTSDALHSMTGFASLRGDAPGLSWIWEIRGVNGRGLDLRLRLPDWIEGLEPAVRAAAQKALHRGNVTISLKIARAADDATAELDPAAL